ncbi:GGDEF domain-containing protein [Ancylobacter sonchi]|uniref:GGDEF domain-containing protein n=1 Tax=Ancylobacter sonchi TaxID=1937790 RepID=UPI001BD6C2CF|nr:GGDEF domain-containing protein [Ancylobacter sonchi]MBS7536416.1 GGDEF domain-containing protein [Ancylobacter sonchi]
MLLDYSSLLVSAGFSTLCVTALFFGAWVSTRSDGFLLTCSIAVAFIVGTLALYRFYFIEPTPARLAMAFAPMLAGLSLLYGAAHQFRRRISPIRPALLGALTLPIALPPAALGYDGIGLGLINLCAGGLLIATAREYWKGRREARIAIAGLCLFYLLVAVSFLLCTLALAIEGNAVLTGPPSNWAEDLNILTVIVAVPGIGAITLALKQARLAQAHKHDAMTDPLTGLLNRRALFDMVEAMAMGSEMAVIVFDLDRFKVVNDTYGHAVGDRVLVHFARALRQHLRKGQLAARLGGEEFALVLSDTGPDTALAHAEAVRASFTKSVQAAKGFTCTVSAGIAFGRTDAGPFEATLNAADQMLYRAKRSGRDRAVVDGLVSGWPESQQALFTQPSSSRP